MGVFRFKKFEVVNESSAMKVNTDGVLLGALMTVRQTDLRCLDIGTGTGTIALMAAQRLTDAGNVGISVDAIDIDEPSAVEAGLNFRNSSWGAFMHARHISIEDFAQTDCRKYDLIFSNPPYFDESLQAPQQRRNNARHTAASLSYREIFEFAQDHLSDEGHVSLILPADQQKDICRYAAGCGFHLFRIVRVRTVPRKSPSRIVVEFMRGRCSCPAEEQLTIQDEGKYTEQYLSLMRDFYLFA